MKFFVDTADTKDIVPDEEAAAVVARIGKLAREMS